MKQVENLLMSVNFRKSVRHDLIPPKFLKLSPPVIASPLTAIINHSVEHCSHPARWKKGQVTPLFKKDASLDKSNYRPVTVLPIFNNIFEKVLSAQLYSYFDGSMSGFISAYWKNYSCEFALLRIVEDWKKVWMTGRLLLLLHWTFQRPLIPSIITFFSPH